MMPLSKKQSNILLLSAILIFAAFAPFISSHHQTTGNNLSIDTFLSTERFQNQIIIPSSFYSNPKYDSTNSIVVVGGHLYYNNGYTWVNISSGGGGMTYYAGWGMLLSSSDSFFVDTSKIATISDVNLQFTAVMDTAQTRFPTVDTTYLFRKVDSNTHKHAVTLDWVTSQGYINHGYFAGYALGLNGSYNFYVDSSKVPLWTDTLSGNLWLITKSKLISYNYLQSNQTINFTGDATGSGATSVALTLATVNASPGTYGTVNVIPSITVDAKGRITAIGTFTITPGSGTVTSVTVNAFSPLFTSSTSNSTTNASTTFSPISQLAHLFYGNNSSGGNPSFVQVNYNDLAGTIPTTTVTVNGTAMITTNSYTITASANTLTSTSLNPTVVNSSLTNFLSVITGGTWNAVIGSSATGTTQSGGDNSTKIATTAYSDQTISNVQSVTSYTVVATDIRKIISFTSNSSISLYIPTGLGSGFNCTIQQNGTGIVTPSGGAILHFSPSTVSKSNGQYSEFSIVQTGNTTDAYTLQGNMQ